MWTIYITSVSLNNLKHWEKRTKEEMETNKFLNEHNNISYLCEVKENSKVNLTQDDACTNSSFSLTLYTLLTFYFLYFCVIIIWVVYFLYLIFVRTPSMFNILYCGQYIDSVIFNLLNYVLKYYVIDIIVYFRFISNIGHYNVASHLV